MTPFLRKVPQSDDVIAVPFSVFLIYFCCQADGDRMMTLEISFLTFVYDAVVSFHYDVFHSILLK